jgi:hypothetical protein
VSDDALWKKRFHLFMAARLFGLATLTLGAAIAFTDLVQPGGSKLIGGVLVVIGAIDAVFAPRVLKKLWAREDAAKQDLRGPL